MSMYTRCPHCDTVFRVTPQQLQVSSGQVRCGRCQQVFDAFATLSSRLAGGTPGTPDAAAPPPPPDAALAAVPAREPPVDYAFEAELSAGPTEPARSLAPPEPEAPLAAPPAVSPQVPARTPEAEVLTLPDEILTGAPASRRNWPWVLGSLLGLAVLAAQGAWLFPTDLALRFPELRPTLVWYCSQVDCKVELPRLPDKLFIEASDLQLLDPTRPTEVLLTATIRNRATVEQALPLLELTLTDGANRALSRKVFTPVEYLGTARSTGDGIGANRDVSVRLYLDTGNIKPVGYRLYLFFA